MKVLAFGASSSKTSINKSFATYAAQLIPNAEVEVLDLNEFELPLFSTDKEAELGQPELAKQFFDKIGQADALVISFAEHNGSYTAAYKNLFDWTSRIDMKVYQNKPMLLLATSPGPDGASNVLAAAKTSAPFFAADVKAEFSLPSFYDHFDQQTSTFKNQELAQKLEAEVAKLTA